MSQASRVILVDDHSLCRCALSDILKRGGVEVLAAVAHPSFVMERVKDEKPDLLILDLNLGDTNGLAVMRSLREQGCDVPVLILTMSPSDEDFVEALRLGVRGYLLKDMEPDEVFASISRAIQGEMVVAPALVFKLTRMLQDNQPNNVPKKDLLASLTDRERQVLEQVARGKSNKAIARVLDISHNTVKLHVRHIMSKLDLSSRVEAVVFSFEHRQGAGAKAMPGATSQGMARVG
jgi:two-component system nitrate/nitrite response regulator NarL